MQHEAQPLPQLSLDVQPCCRTSFALAARITTAATPTPRHTRGAQRRVKRPACAPPTESAAPTAPVWRLSETRITDHHLGPRHAAPHLRAQPRGGQEQHSASQRNKKERRASAPVTSGSRKTHPPEPTSTSPRNVTPHRGNKVRPPRPSVRGKVPARQQRCRRG